MPTEPCLFCVQVPSKLIYRATRDGFKLEDWEARCLGKGPTMTLVQVSRSQRTEVTPALLAACGVRCSWLFTNWWSDLLVLWFFCFHLRIHQAKGSGFVFGAYSECRWPKSNRAGVRDPSGLSFLFSLTNATDKAVRFSLRNSNAPIAISTSVYFGQPASFALNFNLRASEHPRGNTAWPLDAASSYQPDDGDFTRGDDFFAGSGWFAAADIEVYEL